MAGLKRRPVFWPFAEETSHPAHALARELWPLDNDPTILEELNQAVGAKKVLVADRWYVVTC